MERAFIIGCGYTGAALARRLVDAGVAVAGTGRTGGALPGVPGVRLAALDLLDPRGPLPLSGAEGAVVYYMVSTLQRAYDPHARPHLDPPRRILDALAGRGVRGLVYLSSTSVYGDRDGAWVDETTPVAPASPWGRMRVDIENLFIDYGRTLGVPTCVARLPEIYGPGRGPAFRMRRSDYALRFPHRFSNRIHVHDLAAVLHRLGETLAPPVLLVSDGRPAPTGEVYAYTARLLGLPPPPRGEDREGDPNRRGLVADSKRCRNDRMTALLGEPLRYPTYREGIAATVGTGRGTAG